MLDGTVHVLYFSKCTIYYVLHAYPMCCILYTVYYMPYAVHYTVYMPSTKNFTYGTDEIYPGDISNKYSVIFSRIIRANNQNRSFLSSKPAMPYTFELGQGCQARERRQLPLYLSLHSLRGSCLMLSSKANNPELDIAPSGIPRQSGQEQE